MSVQTRFWALLVVAASTFAPNAFGDSTVRVRAVHAPAGTDAAARAQLSKALDRHLAEAKLGESLKPYSLSPSLVQLRRYVESSAKQAKLVCVVDLALSDSQGAVVASVRGNVTTRGADQRETIDAAAYAAVSRLPAALQALSASEKPVRVAAAR